MGLTENRVRWALYPGPGSMGLMQDPSSMGPMQDPSSMGPMQDPGSMGPMQGFGALGPIWGGALGALGPNLGGRVGEAEGRHYGGRRPTKWGSGGEAPRNLGPLGPIGGPRCYPHWGGYWYTPTHPLAPRKTARIARHKQALVDHE